MRTDELSDAELDALAWAAGRQLELINDPSRNLADAALYSGWRKLCVARGTLEPEGAHAIEVVEAEDWSALRAARLAALATNPEAFGSTHEQTAALPDEEWKRRAMSSEEGQTSRWFASVDRNTFAWLGMALVRSEAEETAVINGMWVAPDARGRGIGQDLIDACLGWARERGHTRAVLCVVEDNATALALYERAGFSETRRYVFDPEGRAQPSIELTRDL